MALPVCFYRDDVLDLLVDVKGVFKFSTRNGQLSVSGNIDAHTASRAEKEAVVWNLLPSR